MSRQDIVFPLKDTELREDVHMLGVLVGEVIREQSGEPLFQAVESDRHAAIAWREGDAASMARLAVNTRNIPATEARDLLRAFSSWFEMVNMAEKVHRIRRRRHYLNEGETQPEGIDEAISKLHAHGLMLSDIRRLMLELWIEPVLTAHPMESTRRTILRKQQRVAQLLLGRLGLSRSAAETHTIWARIRSEITSGWQTADNSRERLTLADEREHVLFFMVEILYQIVPIFYEEVEAALLKHYGPEAEELDLPEILRFGSWVGGDMDGNPDVHAKSIRETVARHQQLIVNNYFLECQSLQEALSQSATRVGISAALQARIDHYMVLLPAGNILTPARHDRMPYRVFLGQLLERLRATYEGRQNQYEHASEFLDDVMLIADSLRANKGVHAGLFQVRRLLRRIRTFGFHLATLDIRQNARVHSAVVASGLASVDWSTLNGEQRTARLREALQRDEGPSAALDATGKRTLWVFEALAHCRHRHGPDAIGPYVVSATRGVDDILSVLLLARWADTADRRSGDVPVDVAPLFESAEMLANCGNVMAQLLQEPMYRRHLLGRGNHQYAMLGYSASNKDCGAVTSRWLIRCAQEKLYAAAKAADIDLTLFHGQGGGSFGRGRGRTEVLVRSGPDDARKGRLRITEAGELISEKYGLRPIALRTFEQAFNALSLASIGVMPPEQLEPRWRSTMEQLAEHSQHVYRQFVFDEPQFYEFFRQLTPSDVIERMQIGSRPSSGERIGLDTLRPIPWVHSWSQARYMLPGWYGAGSALAKVEQGSGAQLLNEMYQHWFFFTNLIDDIELALARADLEIASHYDQLVSAEHQHFIHRLRAEYLLTRDHVLAIKGCKQLLDGDLTVQRTIRLRSPYIDPMHLVQVDLLARWRAGARQDKELLAALLASITGISQALQGA